MGVERFWPQGKVFDSCTIQPFLHFNYFDYSKWFNITRKQILNGRQINECMCVYSGIFLRSWTRLTFWLFLRKRLEKMPNYVKSVSSNCREVFVNFGWYLLRFLGFLTFLFCWTIPLKRSINHICKVLLTLSALSPFITYSMS